MKIKGKVSAMVLMVMGLVMLTACESGITSNIYSGSVVINAPPEEVFAYVSDPENRNEWSPAIEEIWDVEGEGFGLTGSWRTKGLGITWEGRSINVDYVPNRRIVSRTIFTNANIYGTETALFVPHPQGTKFIFIQEFTGEIPSALQKMTRDAIRKELQETLEADLKRIKAAVEK